MNRLNNFVLDHPRFVILFLVVITIILGCFIPGVDFDARMEKMIPEDDQVIQNLLDAAKDFGSQDFFLIAIRTDNIYNRDTIIKIKEMQQQLAEITAVKSVLTPLNAQLIESDLLGIKIEAVAEEAPENEQGLQLLRERLNSSSYLGQLVTEEGRAAAIIIKLKAVERLADRRINDISRQVEVIVNQYRDPEDIYIVGDIYTTYYAEKSMKKDIFILLPLMLLILILVLYWSFHSIQGILLPMITVLISVIWTVGLMAILQIPFSIVTVIMPIILLAIGSADGIHILNKYYEELAAGLEKRAALEKTMQEMYSPVIMTSLTTGAGFAALLTSFITPIKEFGLLTALGVLIAMFFSLLFIPAILIIVKKPAHFKHEVREHKEMLVSGLTKLAGFISKYKRVILVTALVIILLFFTGIFRLETEGNMLNYFDPASPIIKGTNIVEEEFGGTLQIGVILDTGKADGIKDPSILNLMLETEDYLNSLPYVSNASSLAGLIQELNQALNLGDEKYYSIPDSRQAVAQELLLFTMQGGSGLESLVNYEFSSAIVTARIENTHSGKIKEVIKQIEDFISEKEEKYVNLQSRVVGTPKVIYRIMDRFISSQIYSFLTSLLTVGVIVAMLMGSIIAGMIACLPLLLTVGFNFGIMGYGGIPLDAVTTMIASIAIGIGVDYSIHYLSRFRQEVRSGKSRHEAVIITGRTAGRGIFFNALTLILGFIILVISHFKAIDVFGLLIALTMFNSSLASLTVVPAVLEVLPVKYLWKRVFKIKGSGENEIYKE